MTDNHELIYNMFGINDKLFLYLNLMTTVQELRELYRKNDEQIKSINEEIVRNETKINILKDQRDQIEKERDQIMEELDQIMEEWDQIEKERDQIKEESDQIMEELNQLRKECYLNPSISSQYVNYECERAQRNIQEYNAKSQEFDEKDRQYDEKDRQYDEKDRQYDEKDREYTDALNNKKQLNEIINRLYTELVRSALVLFDKCKLKMKALGKDFDVQQVKGFDTINDMIFVSNLIMSKNVSDDYKFDLNYYYLKYCNKYVDVCLSDKFMNLFIDRGYIKDELPTFILEYLKRRNLTEQTFVNYCAKYKHLPPYNDLTPSNPSSSLLKNIQNDLPKDEWLSLF